MPGRAFFLARATERMTAAQRIRTPREQASNAITYPTCRAVGTGRPSSS
jgi:hypothetical protein